jgi:hypothetical protein
MGQWLPYHTQCAAMQIVRGMSSRLLELARGRHNNVTDFVKIMCYRSVQSLLSHHHIRYVVIVIIIVVI